MCHSAWSDVIRFRVGAIGEIAKTQTIRFGGLSGDGARRGGRRICQLRRIMTRHLATLIGVMAVAAAFQPTKANAQTRSASDCVDYVNLSNQFGGRFEFTNRCSSSVQVQFCLVPQRGGRIRRSGTIPGRSTRYIDFPAYEGRAQWRMRMCFTGQDCGSVTCP